MIFYDGAAAKIRFKNLLNKLCATRVAQFVLFATLCVLSSFALAIVPGGLVASHNYGTGTASSMEVTIKIEKAPPDNSSYFWAQQFSPNSTVDHGGYFGIQTGGIANGQNVGKMFIFSIWNAVAAEAGPGTIVQSFGGEGVGYSIRKPIAWQEGTPYTFHLEKDGALWWRLTIAGELFGRIQITQDAQMTSGFAAFTEFFSDVPSCSSVPYARVAFSPITFNGSLISASDSTPYGNCINIAKGYLRSDAAVHEVGTPPPACTLTAAPASIITGSSSTMTASCTPAATSYVWTGACLGTTGAICTVSPTASTTYSVTGSNAAGAGYSASTTVAVATTTTTNYQDLWWNQNESGWGMSITQHGSMIFAALYTYDQSGQPTWYVMSSCPISVNSCEGDIYRVSGGTSPTVTWNGSSKAVAKAGTGILTFTDANNGTFDYTLNGVTGSKSISRQVFSTGTTLPAVDYTDLWWNANESGWGVALSQQYGIIFAAWYTYDATGKAIWYVASSCPVSGSGCTGDVYQVTGGSPLTSIWNSSNKAVTKAGSVTFVFTDANNGSMSYSINGIAGNRVITRQEF